MDRWRSYPSVLNLIISGMPSIPVIRLIFKDIIKFISFKPYYKWNAFNTKRLLAKQFENTKVLNLIINGMPSILPN